MEGLLEGVIMQGVVSKRRVDFLCEGAVPGWIKGRIDCGGLSLEEGVEDQAGIFIT